MTTESPRVPQAEVDPIFLERWSPRSFSDEGLTEAQVSTLFEAARWAPSCFNAQPWLFVYGVRGSADHDAVASVVMEGNRTWSDKAPLLGVVFACRNFEYNGEPNRWAAFDSGAASFSLALQASRMGLASHFMGGFDAERAYEALGVSADDYVAMAAFAVGHRGDAAALPENLREREAPSDRKALTEVASTVTQQRKGATS